MKNIITAMAVAFSLFFGLSVSVYAAGEPDVYVDKEGKLQTQNLNFDAFENMASGESATEVISVAKEKGINLLSSELPIYEFCVAMSQMIK